MVQAGELVVTLNWHEAATAAREGVQRRIRQLALNRTDRLKTLRGVWDNDVESACAERAVAKALGIYWPESAELDYDGDLPNGIHVRWTDYAAGHLIVYPGDPDDGRFYLAVGRCPCWRVAGWLYGAEAKRPGWWDATRLALPGFMVPQSELYAPDVASRWTAENLFR
jgi:hypothetical protein